MGSAAELKAMSGRSLFVASVEQGWIDRNSVESVERVVDVAYITEQTASASIPGGNGEAVFRFQKESGEWRLSMSRLFAAAEVALDQAMSQSPSEAQFHIQALSMISDKRVDTAIYEKLLVGPLH